VQQLRERDERLILGLGAVLASWMRWQMRMINFTGGENLKSLRTPPEG
jgi:hypothetical protein